MPTSANINLEQYFWQLLLFARDVKN